MSPTNKASFYDVDNSQSTVHICTCHWTARFLFYTKQNIENCVEIDLEMAVIYIIERQSNQAPGHFSHINVTRPLLTHKNKHNR